MWRAVVVAGSGSGGEKRIGRRRGMAMNNSVMVMAATAGMAARLPRVVYVPGCLTTGFTFPVGLVATRPTCLTHSVLPEMVSATAWHNVGAPSCRWMSKGLGTVLSAHGVNDVDTRIAKHTTGNPLMV